MSAPIPANIRLNIATDRMACRNTARASPSRAAPTWCATCTENPVAAALHVPQKSHVVVDTSPMLAAASAPRRPTIAASMYCMAMAEI